MDKLFPTGNQMIDSGIRYANEPGFAKAIKIGFEIRTDHA